MTQLIKNLKSWHWGLLFESQRVTWTTFPILAMFLLIHLQFLQKTAPLASIFGASVFVQFWSVDLFNEYWDRLRQHFHRTQANHLSDLNIDPILFRRLVCHTRIQLKTFCHCYQEWLVFANSVFFSSKRKNRTINAMNENVHREAIASIGAGNLLPQCSLQCGVRTSTIPLSLDLFLLFFCGERNSSTCTPFLLFLPAQDGILKKRHRQ